MLMNLIFLAERELMMLLIILLAYVIEPYPVIVQDYPGDDAVYLVWEEVEDGHDIALVRDMGDEPVLMTGFTAYPGMFNSAKVFAAYDADNCILSVYSQYPFSANYYLATYSHSFETGLVLLEGEAHDYYMERFDDIREHVGEDSLDAALQSGWEIMYPFANPYGLEMCLILLSAVHEQSIVDLEAGVPLETVLEVYDDLSSLSYQLTDQSFQAMIALPADYPEDADITLEEYCLILMSYADLLEEAGDSSFAVEVREGADNLLEPL